MVSTDGIHFKIKTDQFRLMNLVTSDVCGRDFIVGGDVGSDSADHHEGYDSFTPQRH